MASYFWVGGTGNWDGTTNHFATTSGGTATVAAPTTADTVTFDGSSGGGTVTLTATGNCSAFTMSAFTGTFNTNGQTFNCVGSFTNGNGGTRTLTLGASTINAGSWQHGSTAPTGLTFNANTSTINITGSSSAPFQGGGLTYNNVVFQTNSVSSNGILGTNTFANLTFQPTTPNTTFSVGIGANQTITGTLTTNNGATATNRVLLYSSAVGVTQAIGTPRTLTCAAVTLSQVDFMDITGAGAATWSGTSVGDCGGNSGITFTTPTTQHFTNVNGGTWSTLANWTSRVPLPQDTVIIDTAFGASKILTADLPRLGGSVDFSSATWTTAFTFTSNSNLAYEIFGSLTCKSGMTFSQGGSGTMVLGARSGGVITGNGATISADLTMLTTGTYLLGSDLVFAAGFYFGESNVNNKGTLSTTNGGTAYNLTMGNTGSNGFGTTSSAILTLGASTLTILDASFNSFNMGSGVINAGTSKIIFTNTTATARTFVGGGKTYYDLIFNCGSSTANITISGSNTFNSIKDLGTAAHSILFTAGTTQTMKNFFATGSSGNAITLNSTTTATFALVCTSGTAISCDWLNIQHSVATPSSGVWFAGANSVNNQATATAGSGWIFSAAPPQPIPSRVVQANQSVNRAGTY